MDCFDKQDWLNLPLGKEIRFTYRGSYYGHGVIIEVEPRCVYVKLLKPCPIKKKPNGTLVIKPIGSVYHFARSKTQNIIIR